MKVKKLKAQPKDIKTVYIEAVLVPNGEIICYGTTVGWYKKLKQFIYEKDTKRG